MKRVRHTITHRPDTVPWWLGLQIRIAFSYAATMFGTMLFLESLVVVAVAVLIFYNPQSSDDFTRTSQAMARQYALEAAVQAQGDQLNPQTTFAPGSPSSLLLHYATSSIPYIAQGTSPKTLLVSFALLVDRHGQVVASSYPERYPSGANVSTLLPQQRRLILNGLAGLAGSVNDSTSKGRTANDIEPVMTGTQKVIGVIYISVPQFSSGNPLQGILMGLLFSAVLWLILTVPIGALFSLITTRGMVRRLRRLINATQQFADGDYTQRVRVLSRDEVGLLEEHFNQMAEQLVTSIARQHVLAEQGARLEERARLARDLHDSVKQQIFALAMKISAALALLDQRKELALSHLQDAETLAYQAQQELTTLIRELRPLALQDNKGLAVALQEYATTWSRQQDITIDVQVPATLRTLPAALEEALLRVTQEALSNIVRHSQASYVQLKLADTEQQIELTIADNGRGFDSTGSNESGVGLHSMQERMEELGGTLLIESQPGRGTRINARCPYQHDRDESVS